MITAAMDKKSDIEEQLRQAILNAGMSRYALSKMAGVTQAMLSRFVHRQRSITMGTAAKLAAALGLEFRPVRGRRKGR
ncbi:MAG: helix-turn-helix domain-containing protein [Planctomycetes bacterium]|nr:helix-turn-helix domain-containing protein [Planctomycetota bacterium]